VILRKILLAVKHMHDMDVVHRDLKPENILFSEPGIDSEVKVWRQVLHVWGMPLDLLCLGDAGD
jgi:serine/threonine protein kinase